MADQFWMKPAKNAEQGSHCDTDSQRHIDNCSKREAEEQQENAMYRGESVVAIEGEPSNFPDGQRFNTALTDVDDVGYDYPTKHRPGR